MKLRERLCKRWGHEFSPGRRVQTTDGWAWVMDCFRCKHVYGFAYEPAP